MSVRDFYSLERIEERLNAAIQDDTDVDSWMTAKDGIEAIKLLRAENAELRAKLDDAVTAEREACAKLCWDADKSTHPSELAAAIEARGKGER